MCSAGHPLSLGLHDSARPVLPRAPTISNPPPLISSTKHPSVLERQMGAISQVRRAGQPQKLQCGLVPENSPFLFRSFGLSTCSVGVLGPVKSGWRLGSSLFAMVLGPALAGACPWHSGPWEVIHGAVKSVGSATRPCGPGQVTQPRCVCLPSVKWELK